MATAMGGAAKIADEYPMKTAAMMLQVMRQPRSFAGPVLLDSTVLDLKY
jgi:hypothetical protein